MATTAPATAIAIASPLRRLLLHVWASGLVCPTETQLAEWPEGPGTQPPPCARAVQAVVRPSEWTVSRGEEGPTRLTLASRELRFDVAQADGRVTVTWLVGGAGTHTLHGLLEAACQCASDTATKLARVCADPGDPAAMASLDAASQVLVGRAWETLHRRLWIATVAWWLERGAPTHVVPSLLPAPGTPVPIIDVLRCKVATFRDQHEPAASAAEAEATDAGAEAVDAEATDAGSEAETLAVPSDVHVPPVPSLEPEAEPEAEPETAAIVLDTAREEEEGAVGTRVPKTAKDPKHCKEQLLETRTKKHKACVEDGGGGRAVSRASAAMSKPSGAGLRGLLQNPAFLRALKTKK
jgi:hypothetical protein